MKKTQLQVLKKAISVMNQENLSFQQWKIIETRNVSPSGEAEDWNCNIYASGNRDEIRSVISESERVISLAIALGISSFIAIKNKYSSTPENDKYANKPYIYLY